jgi:hypothetical protein
VVMFGTVTIDQSKMVSSGLKDKKGSPAWHDIVNWYQYRPWPEDTLQRLIVTSHMIFFNLIR